MEKDCEEFKLPSLVNELKEAVDLGAEFAEAKLKFTGYKLILRLEPIEN